MLHLRTPSAASGQTRLDDFPADASSSILRNDRQMIKKSAATVVAAEHCTDQPRTVSGDKAEFRIAIEKGLKHVQRQVRFRQPDAIRLGPKIMHGVKVGGRHGRVGNVHHYTRP